MTTPLIAASDSSLLIVQGTGDVSTFPTLADYRHALADQLGTFGAFNVSAVATGGEPGRYVLVDELRDDEEERSKFAGAYVYAMTGDQQGISRRILREGYEGPFGALRLARPFPAALAAGTAIELTSPLPVKRTMTVKGLNEIIAEALKRLTVRARIPLTGNSTRMYSLAAYPWLTTKDQTDGIYDYGLGGLSTTVDPPFLNTLPYDIRTDGATITLETAWSYGTTDTFFLSAFVPADRLIYDGTIWAYNPAGLHSDTDQAAAPESWVTIFGMVKALAYLRRLTLADKRLTQDEKKARLGEILTGLQTWGTAAASLVENVLPRPTPEPAQGLLYGCATTSGSDFYGSNYPARTVP